jgi:FKBP-type peptidyl-prolyl cis-trans isomerase
MRRVFIIFFLWVACTGCGTSSRIDADAFFRENAKRPEVKTMPSGLQYVVHREGDGPVPDVTDDVTVHYVGQLLNDDVFDSSYDRGEPIRMSVLKFIPGWVEALKQMPEGSEWTLYVPSELAYGKRRVSNKIGPNTPLKFKISLLKVHRE